MQGRRDTQVGHYVCSPPPASVSMSHMHYRDEGASFVPPVQRLCSSSGLLAPLSNPDTILNMTVARAYPSLSVSPRAHHTLVHLDRASGLSIQVALRIVHPPGGRLGELRRVQLLPRRRELGLCRREVHIGDLGHALLHLPSTLQPRSAKETIDAHVEGKSVPGPPPGPCMPASIRYIEAH